MMMFMFMLVLMTMVMIVKMTKMIHLRGSLGNDDGTYELFW